LAGDHLRRSVCGAGASGDIVGEDDFITVSVVSNFVVLHNKLMLLAYYNWCNAYIMDLPTYLSL